MPQPALPNPILMIDEAVESRLRTAFDGKWTIERVPDPMTLAEFEHLLRSTPWIGLGWASLAATPQGRRVDGTLGFTLTICLRNPGAEARFKGDSRGPGIYTATLAAAALLHGMTVPGVGTIQVTGAASAFAEGHKDRQIAIARLAFEVIGISLGDFMGAVAAADDLKELVSGWDFEQAEDEPADTIVIKEDAA